MSRVPRHLLSPVPAFQLAPPLIHALATPGRTRSSRAALPIMPFVGVSRLRLRGSSGMRPLLRLRMSAQNLLNRLRCCPGADLPT